MENLESEEETKSYINDKLDENQEYLNTVNSIESTQNRIDTLYGIKRVMELFEIFYRKFLEEKNLKDIYKLTYEYLDEKVIKEGLIDEYKKLLKRPSLLETNEYSETAVRIVDEILDIKKKFRLKFKTFDSSDEYDKSLMKTVVVVF